MRMILGFVGVLALGAGAGLWLTRPQTVDPGQFAALTGDAAAGEAVFHAAGCGSCHMAPEAEGEARLVLSGGQRFPSPFGTFVAPNISPSGHGIGGWSVQDLANALWHGTSPEGAHYYPVFPYTAYARMTATDVADLHAYLATLPLSDQPSRAHELGFPFNIRASLGGWKLLFVGSDWVLDAPDLTAEEDRGRYLVEALGHCAECHTPRNALGALDRSRWMQGAVEPAGTGRVPGITPAQLGWSQQDVAAYLMTGFTPDYDSVGGHMALVVANFARLPDTDRAAVAAYLARLSGP